MHARKLSSKKWTSLPKEYLSQIQSVFESEFEASLMKGWLLEVDGKIYFEEVVFRLGLRGTSGIRQHNFYVSIDTNAKLQDANEKIPVCVDAAASMAVEFFASTEETVDFPADWQIFDFGAEKIYLAYDTINTKLESMADQILGEKSDSLVVGHELEDIDALDLASEDKIDTEAAEAIVKKAAPTIFSKFAKKK
jgi:hypothetical protein